MDSIFDIFHISKKMNSKGMNDNNYDDDGCNGNEDNEKQESNEGNNQNIEIDDNEEIYDDDEYEEYSDTFDCYYENGDIEDEFDDDFDPKNDIEYFDFKCINYDNAKSQFESMIDSASNLTKVFNLLICYYNFYPQFYFPLFSFTNHWLKFF